MITALYSIKIRSFLDTFLKSYQAHCISIFSNFIINKYGKMIQIKIQYYKPHKMNTKKNLKYLKIMNKFLTQKSERFLGNFGFKRSITAYLVRSGGPTRWLVTTSKALSNKPGS